MRHVPFSPLVLAWIALLVLLAASCGSAYVHLGPWNAVLNYGIAAAKAIVVLLAFMHLRRGPAMVRIAAAAGVFFLALLAGLSATDFLAR
jgi:cytochrome c oxidase subunit 4